MRSNVRLIFYILLIIMSFGYYSSTLEAINNVSVDKEQNNTSIKQAISSVYPALVQIYVLALNYQGGRENKSQAAGSGVIISTEGYIVTNHHVAGKAAMIKCILPTKEEINATLIGTDPLTDIAVIKLDLSSRRSGAPPIVFARFGDSDKLKVGDPVLAMGCPMALSQSVTSGIVSNKEMTIPKILNTRIELDGEDVGSLVRWIGHDAQIFTGNSGGPLVNLNGEIIGINELGIGLAAAIPGNLVKKISDELIANGHVKRAWIGAEFQPLLKSSIEKDITGVLLSGVLSGSPADRAGIKPGDIVQSIDGKPVGIMFQQELPDFTNLIISKQVGHPVDLNIYRSEKKMLIKVTPELRDEARGNDLKTRDWGLTVRRLSLFEMNELSKSNQNGIIISSVRPGGPSEQAQPPLQANDFITEVGGKPITDIDSFTRITEELTRGKTDPIPILIAFERRNEKIFSLVTVGVRQPQNPPAEVDKAWLPVATQVLSKKLAVALNLKGKQGVRITRVYPDSVAQFAGFQVGDIITHIDDQAIESSEWQYSHIFEAMLRAYKIGSKPEFTVLRDNQILKISSVLVSAPKPLQELRTYEDSAFEFRARDITYIDRIQRFLNKNESGVLITQTDQGGWAILGGLRPDDLILKINDNQISNVVDLERNLSELRGIQPKQVTFFVRRGIHTLFIELEPRWTKKINKI